MSDLAVTSPEVGLYAPILFGNGSAAIDAHVPFDVRTFLRTILLMV